MKSRYSNVVVALAATGAIAGVAVFVGSAMRARAQSGKAAVGVGVSVPSQIPLLATETQPQYSPLGELQRVTFKLFNRGSQPLTAVEISWTLKFAGGGTSRATDYIDYWAQQGGPLASGAADTVEFSGATSQKPGGAVEPLVSAMATVAYAEFEDGSKYGPSIEPASVWFTSERTAKVAAYRELLQDYRAGGEPELIKALQRVTPAQTGAARGTRRYLYALYRSSGTTAVVAELTRVASLPVPPG